MTEAQTILDMLEAVTEDTPTKTLDEIDVEEAVQESWVAFESELTDTELALLRVGVTHLASQGYLKQPDQWQPIEGAKSYQDYLVYFADTTITSAWKNNCGVWESLQEGVGVFHENPTHCRPMIKPPEGKTEIIKNTIDDFYPLDYEDHTGDL